MTQSSTVATSKTNEQHPPPVTRRLSRTRVYSQSVKVLKIGNNISYNKL